MSCRIYSGNFCSRLVARLGGNSFPPDPGSSVFCLLGMREHFSFPFDLVLTVLECCKGSG